MRAPKPSVAFFGHPAIAGPLVLGGLGLLVMFLTQGEGGFLLAVPVAVGLAWLAKAMEKVSAYRAWRKAWDAMGEPPVRRRWPWKPLCGVLFVTLVFGHALAHPERPDATAAAGMVVVALGLGIVAVLLRSLVRLFRRPRRRVAKNDPMVTICARPIFPVPSLRDAYIALPEHCWQVLGRQ